MRAMAKDRVRVICAVCGRKYAGKVPKGGDGSEMVPYRHVGDRGDGEICEGVYVWAEWVDD